MVLSRVGKSRHTVDISANLLTTSTDDQLIVRDSPCFIQSTRFIFFFASSNSTISTSRKVHEIVPEESIYKKKKTIIKIFESLF